MKKKSKLLYELLKHRPFCRCSITEKDLYEAYCLRIVETLEIWEKENGNM